jgi:hypothetical protein
VHPTTDLITSAASGALRIESNGALIEGQRTNLALQSEDFGTTWSAGTNITKSLDNAVAPDGNTTADLILETTEAAYHEIRQAFSTLEDNTAYVFSVYMKPMGRNSVKLTYLTKAGGYPYCRINYTTGADIGSSGVTCSSTIAQNGFYRVTAYVSSISSGATVPALYITTALDNGTINHTGDNTAGFYLWGAQLEAASFPSSYIPTTTAAVTRNADVLSVPNSGNFNAYTGTVAFTYNPNQLTSTGYAWSAKTYVSIAYISGGTSYRITEGTNIGTYATKSISSIGTDYKLAHSYGGTSFKATIDGGAVEEDTFAGEYPLATNFYFGNDGSGNPSLYGHLKNFRMWNRAFTDAELQSITR